VTHWERTFARDGLIVRTVNHTVLSADHENFYVHADLDAYENDRRVFTKSWDRVIPRALV
jgi:hypothetical protein